MSVCIIAFDSIYANKFKELNAAWLEKYFYIEAKDTVLLDDCKNSIINNNGYTFFAEYPSKIVGCFSFIKMEENCYELCKMAVDFKYQGLKIGQELIKFAIQYAKKAIGIKLYCIQALNFSTPCIFIKSMDLRKLILKRTCRMQEVILKWNYY
tara:strand:+ start:119894 stop:120352 length:459 start_codon:yes stop_codon:yes gene_type:complete